MLLIDLLLTRTRAVPNYVSLFFGLFAYLSRIFEYITLFSLFLCVFNTYSINSLNRL